MLNLLKRLTGSSSSRRQTKRQSRSVQLNLESLDGRILPSATGYLSAVTDGYGQSVAFTVGGADHMLYEHDNAGWHNLYSPGYGISSVSASKDASGRAMCFCEDRWGQMWQWTAFYGWQYMNLGGVNQYSATDHGSCYAVDNGDRVYETFWNEPGYWNYLGTAPGDMNYNTSITQLSTGYSGTFVGVRQNFAGFDSYNVFYVDNGGHWSNTGTRDINNNVQFTQISAIPNYQSVPYDCFAVDAKGNIWRHDTWSYGNNPLSTGHWELYDQGHQIYSISASGGSNLVAMDIWSNVYVINQWEDYAPAIAFAAGGPIRLGVANTVVADTGDNTFYTLNHMYLSSYNQIFDGIDEFSYSPYWGSYIHSFTYGYTV